VNSSAPEGDQIYAPHRTVTNLDECYFYHTMDIPGHGVVEGEWDLRGSEHQYLGGVDFAGKRVLELGPASGFLTAHMERQGAEVVAYDLSEDFSWDVVPFAGVDRAKADQHRRQHLRRINNGWWLSHHAHGSKARVVYGTIYTVPAAIGPVDIATFASILLHVRDPFLALQSAAPLVKDQIVVTDMFPTGDFHVIGDIMDRPGPQGTETRGFEFPDDPKMVFLPRHWDQAYGDTWWLLSPSVIQRFLGVLGFEKTEVTYHFAASIGNPRSLMYTVVGYRTKDV
jgi:SAM-dependent methyltransferase